MNISAKKRNILIAILISLTVMLATFCSVFFNFKNNDIQADAYRYGDFNTTGYYVADGVVFYAIKVEEVNGVVPEINVDVEEENVEEELKYTFTLNDVEYTIDNISEPTQLTYTGNEGEITIPIAENKYFTIGGIDYAFDLASNPTKVLQVSFNYWPSYNIVMKNGNPVFVKFEETVLLGKDESILICFARQTDNDEKDNALYIKDGEKQRSVSVDFLSGGLTKGIITINGEEINNDLVNTLSILTPQGNFQKEFGYILDLNGNEIDEEGEGNLLGIASGDEYEGKIEFTASYEIGTVEKEFSFMFYAFKEDTYQRKETIHNDPNQHFFRPTPALRLSDTTLVEHVTDFETSTRFFSESFYHYKNTSKIPYLEYDYMRYEISITKTIHSTTTTYDLSYELLEGKVLYSKAQNPSTANIYAQDLMIKEVENTTKIRIYLPDLGVYDFSYTAIYYNEDNTKIKLDSINQKYNLQDRLTVYGTQLTYQDIKNGKSSFREFYNTIYADVTGLGFTISSVEGGIDLDFPEGFDEKNIASTNQPQVGMLFNSKILTGEDFKVYYTQSLKEPFVLKENYVYTSLYTEPGYYYITVSNQYQQYKIWLGDSTSYSTNSTKTQNYFFQIKDQTPNLKIYQLNDEGNIPNVGEEIEILSGSYTKNGVQILEAEKTSIFDSPITLTVFYRTFNQSDLEMTEIDLPTKIKDEESGIEYYKFRKNGRYSVKLNFGKSGVTTCTFDIDTDPISGITLYNVNPLPPGSSYYPSTLIGDQNQFITTNKSVSLLWDNKESGAKITATYMYFDMADYIYSDVANDYILNDTWLAADYSINLSDQNAITPYTKASLPTMITYNSVINNDGLYIFKLEDEAGNVAYYSFLIDTSIPTVLQTVEDGSDYYKISGINNVSGNTEIFFGSQKAIALLLDGAKINDFASISGCGDIFVEYLTNFKKIIDTVSATSIGRDVATNNYFITIPIRKVNFKTLSNLNYASVPQTHIDRGWTVLVPENIDGTDRLANGTYIYYIYDASNRSTLDPTRTYSIRVNTDNTGIAVVDREGDDAKNISFYASQTSINTQNNYHVPTNTGTLYLTWKDLTIESLDVFVDLAGDGLKVYYYGLIWNSSKNSFEYSSIPVDVTPSFEGITLEQIGDGYNSVRLPINFTSAGITTAGKYEIVRIYSPNNQDDDITYMDLGNDYATVITTFFVDRSEIITAPTTSETQNGYYTYATLFDGGNQNNKLFYNLYQSSANFETNMLPVGFYIPVAKYGTIYKTETESYKREDIQNLLDGYKFTDLVHFYDLDTITFEGEQSSDEYSPYRLTVVLKSPGNIYYYYSYEAATGYFKLSTWSVGEKEEKDRTTIQNPQAFITSEPWKIGDYELCIKAVSPDSVTYLQNYTFSFKISNPTPTYNVTSQYPELQNMEDRVLTQASNGNYYTNARRVVIKWTESNNVYLTKIDTETVGAVKYTYYINGVGTPINAIITSNGNNRSFTIDIPTGTNQLSIVMAYRTYSTDIEDNYRKYYNDKLYQSSKTIIIDIIAPTDTITQFINNNGIYDDITVSKVPASSLRATVNSQGMPLDTRFDKTITTGIYKYYSFMASVDFLANLSKDLSTNSNNNTKYFYYKYFPGKYSTTYNETGLGLDPTAPANNLFSEYYALRDGWTKIQSTTDLGSSFNEGYYEIIEVDLAGNMTIYTIYISSDKNLNINFTQKLSAAIPTPGNGNLVIKKSDPTNISINSYDTFNFESFNFSPYSYDEGENENSYKYIRINIDEVPYLVTPYGYTNEVCTSVVRLSDGQSVPLDSLSLSTTINNVAHSVSIIDAINKKTYVLAVQVVSDKDRIDYPPISSDNPNLATLTGQTATISLVITEKVNAPLKFNPSSLIIYKINGSDNPSYKIKENDITALNSANYSFNYSDNTYISVYKATSSTTGYTTYYLYLNKSGSDFETSTFLFAFKDYFGNEYVGTNNFVQYKSVVFDRYVYDGIDLTAQMQANKNILVSKSIVANFSNLYDIDISAKIGDSPNYEKVNNNKTYCDISSQDFYKSYNLYALSTISSGYRGGLVEYKLKLSANIPNDVILDLNSKGFNISSENNIIETIDISIYNQVPTLLITDLYGNDITDNLLNEQITQSDPVVISFNTGNNLSDSLEIISKVFIRLRGSEQGYYQITSPKTVSEPGIYDIYIQNFDSTGKALDYVESYDFAISDLDILFYTVVKTNTEGQQEIVSPTGTVFSYTSEGTKYVPYHYVVNTNNYEILRNGEKITVTPIMDLAGTKVYKITSTSGTIFETTIAVTVIPATDNILGGNFIWYYGEVYNSTTSTKISSSNPENIYLTQGDTSYSTVTLRWSSYYSNIYNKINCYISSDDGQSWILVQGIAEGENKTLTLTRSCSYLFKFIDYAGNIQTFTSSGYPSTTTKVTFIRSVIYKLNGNSPLNNSIYNTPVTISIPAGTNIYYSSPNPKLHFSRNNEALEEVNISGNYIFTEPGTYVIYFSVKVKNGTKDLNQDKLTFTIINPNDSMWAFNYSNYSNYTINYIKYNGLSISSNLRTFATSGNEINISSFIEDSIGNKYFNNGIYTIKMTSIDPALGTQSFEFNFWLNDSTPPITVSLAEGRTTTDPITVTYNKTNLYETLGDCYVVVNNQIVEQIDETSSGLSTFRYTSIRPYYIQVYTNSGKLSYSYRVEITEPLNTITIILIVAASVVVITGALLFFLLRKKMKVR